MNIARPCIICTDTTRDGRFVDGKFICRLCEEAKVKVEARKVKT